MSSSSKQGDATSRYPLAPLIAAVDAAGYSVSTAMWSGTAACMRDRGFELQEETPTAPSSFDVTRYLERRYGHPQIRASDDVIGYAFSDETSSTPARSPQSSFPITEAYVAALQGTNSTTMPLHFLGNAAGDGPVLTFGDGCQRTGVLTAFATLDDYARWVQLRVWMDDVQAAGFVQIATDPAGAQVSADWSSCMREHGYSYVRPTEMSGSDFDTPRPGAIEQATARTDLQCREESNVDERMRQIDVAAQMRELDRVPDLVSRLTTIAESASSSRFPIVVAPLG